MASRVHHGCMILLRFRAENHRSFREELELSLVKPGANANTRAGVDWRGATLRAAAIYGANASGKSTVLSAIQLARNAIKLSATGWKDGTPLPNNGHLLDAESASRPSSYSLDFVHDEIRYEYGFSHDREAFLTEWLFEHPDGRRRLLFERDELGEKRFRFGRALGGERQAIAVGTTRDELFLSKGASSNHEQLKTLQSAIVDGLIITRFGDGDRENRLSAITEGLARGTLQPNDVVTLLQVADVGIEGVEVRQDDLPAQFVQLFEALSTAGQQVASSLPGLQMELASGPMQTLTFRHAGANGETHALRQARQSSGTLNWLALAVPALDALRRGSVLLVDEIDASLHPQLAQVLVDLFREEGTNRSGAQIIFTTHDTFFISPTSGNPLSPEETWFVEKSAEGQSDLYSLDEFPNRSSENFARRYLQGRYGAIPSPVPALVSTLFLGKVDQKDTY